MDPSILLNHIETPDVPPDRNFLAEHGYIVTCWYDGLIDKIGEMIAKAAKWLADKAAAVVAWITDKLAKVVATVKKVIEKVIEAVTWVLNKVKDAVAWVARLLDRIATWITVQISVMVYRLLGCRVTKAPSKRMGA